MTKNGKKGIPQNLLRQKLLAKLLSEDGGKTPIGKLMKKAGYSDAYAKNPNKLKNTLTWEDLMEKNLPDDLLSQRHNELLTAVTIGNYVFSISLTDDQIRDVVESAPGCKLIKIQRSSTSARAYFTAPDNKPRKDAIDMAYKLKNKYPASKVDVTSLGKRINGFQYVKPQKPDGRDNPNN